MQQLADLGDIEWRRGECDGEVETRDFSDFIRKVEVEVEVF